MELAFEGIRLELKLGNKNNNNNNKESRILLDGSCRGRARPGRMLAILGPSGAGKSSLLHALAGRLKANSKLTLQGYRYINGHSVDGHDMLPAAFIEQDVSFFPHMTVRETLEC